MINDRLLHADIDLTRNICIVFIAAITKTATMVPGGITENYWPSNVSAETDINLIKAIKQS